MKISCNTVRVLCINNKLKHHTLKENKNKENKKLIKRRIINDLIIDTCVCIITNKTSHKSLEDLSIHLLISYQNDIFMIYVSSLLSNFYFRGVLFFILGLFTSLISNFMIKSQLHLEHISLAFNYAISMMFLSNYRYHFVNKLEKKHKDLKYFNLYCFVLRLLSNILGSFQYLLIVYFTNYLR